MLASILAGIASVAAIVAAVKYWTQLTVWLFKKSSDQKAQSIDEKVSDEEKKVDAGGRPQW